MLLLFSLHPFFALLGIAAQYLGLVVCAIGAGYFCFGQGCQALRAPLKRLGLALIVSWAVWPLCNVLAFLAPAADSAIGPLPALDELLFAKTGRVEVFRLLKSLFFVSAVPTSVLLSGVALLVFARLAPKGAAAVRSPLAVERWLVRLGWAVVLLGFYVAVQHVTGYDVRPKLRALPNMQFPDGRYRVLGFSGHPLTMASMALAVFGWSAFLLVRPKAAELATRLSRMWLAVTAALSFFFVFASGGRTALVVAMGSAVVLLVMALWLRRAVSGPVRWPRVLAGGAAASGVLVACLYLSPIYARFAEFASQLAAGRLPNRVIFWQVHGRMFLDAPLWGQGLAQMTLGVRRAYYDALGWSGLSEKYNAHNMIFETIASVGILGVCLLLVCLWQAYTALRDLSAQSTTATRAVFAALLFSIVLNAIHGLTQNVFYDSGVMMVYLLFFWLVVWSAVASGEQALGGDVKHG